MANEHPFQMLFETLGRLPIAHADSVNRQAYEILYDILSVPVEKPGRCILLRAPRAGHGKTHLLSRIQHHLGASHEFIPLHASFGCQIDAATVIDDALRRLLRPLPASGGLTVLDLVARRLFAAALQPLVGSGEVPCQDREGALTALRTRPIETFDFHHPNAVTAHWARENFEVLGQRLSVELSQRSGLPAREVAFWVDALFRFAATPVENPVRLRVLGDAIHAGNPADGVLMERLEALLGLLALLMRVVIVADDLEGFSSDETAALRLAAFLGSLRQTVERLDVILSLNQDIWQSAFLPRLSGGLADRLSEVVVELNPLTEDEMIALLESRVPGLGARVLSRVDRSSAGTHARGLIRAAGVAWLRASAMDTQAAAPPVAAPVAVATALPEPVVAAKVEEPVVPVPEPTPAEIPAPPAAPEVVQPVERVPDPTLAIAFLAAQQANQPAAADSATQPDEAAPDIQEAAAPPASPFEIEPVFSSLEPEAPVAVAVESSIFEPQPEPVQSAPGPEVWPSQVESPFQVAPSPDVPVFMPEPATPAFTPAAPEVAAFQPPPEPVAAPYFQPAPEPAPVFQAAPEFVPTPTFQPAPDRVAAAIFQAAQDPEPALVFQTAPEFSPTPAFQPAQEPERAPVFQAAPEFTPAPPFQPAPENPPAVVSQPVAEPAREPVPDTDRVDDLLRQFRERYGRGSM